MRTEHGVVVFGGRQVGKRLETSNKTLVGQCLPVVVGLICLMWGIDVCRGPLAVQAATIPTGYVPFGKYVKVGSTDYISGHELACQPGSDFCGEGTAWHAASSTCIIPGVTIGGTTITTMQALTSARCESVATPTGTD